MSSPFQEVGPWKLVIAELLGRHCHGMETDLQVGKMGCLFRLSLLGRKLKFERYKITMPPVQGLVPPKYTNIETLVLYNIVRVRCG